MKKLTLILAAMALTLGLSQCKKTETPTTDKGVFITLTAGYSNGAKTGFNPETGAFTWTGTTENPEYINVGGSTHGYLGQLTSTQSGETVTFSGTITPSERETLYFFYLGKGNHASATSVDFSNQDGTLANVTNYHIAISNGIVYNGQTSFSATLNMKMAIAYFDVNGFKNASDVAETVYLHGDEVYSTATINYSEGTITGNAKGSISLGTATAGKYVALIPSVSTETTLKFDSDSKTGAMIFLRGIQTGKYYANSGAALSVAANSCLFSVSGAKKVRFSQGNLQYIGSAGNGDETNTGAYWKFADNQWAIFGWNGQQNGGETIDRDMFPYGTSGYPHGAILYQPWSYNSTTANYYAYGSSSNNLEDETGQADWGYNVITNGGNHENSGWRTLTIDEWQYLFEHCTYGMATVNSNKGIIIIPNGSSSNINTNHDNWTNNVFDETTSPKWSELETNGAVFLPTAGYRRMGQINNLDKGYYWSSSSNGNSFACILYFDGQKIDYSRTRNHARDCGTSVRLVRDIE